MNQWFDPNRPLSEAESTPPVSHIYRRIWRFMMEFKAGLGVAIGLSFITSLAFALLPWPIRYLIDGVLLSDELDVGIFGTYESASDSQKLQLALILALIYLLIQLVAAVGASTSFYFFAKTALFMIHTLRGRMMAHLRKLSLGFHATKSTGDMIFRAMTDARAIQEVMIFGVQAWILPLFQVTLMVALMLVLDWALTLAALAISPLLIFTIRKLTARIQAASQQSRGHLSRLTALIEQTMNSIRAVQVFGSEGNEAQRFDGTSRNFIKAQLKFRMAEQALSVGTMAITGLGTALVLYVAANRVIAGAVTVGALWIFINYMQRIYDVLQQNMNLFGMLQDSVVGVGRAFQILDTEPAITDSPGAVAIDGVRQGITFDGVGLSYEAAAQPVLRGVALGVARGEKIALVGPTGSGKTSILNLIPRLYETSSGAVRIDDSDVRDIQLASLREQISLVPQEPLLFSTSVRENILYGRRTASEEEIVAAARAARAHDFIVEMPDGYDTEIGDRGAKLSIGQQQRLAIARAFLKDAPILLLDEPTSALDLQTEAEFLDELESLMEGRTVIMVAHRLSTVRNADRIYVLDQGRVTESGHHDELMAVGGHYHRLYSSQFA
ncbi:MAG: ABC transporter ATP-binding protein [Acidimicrobiales bacterium]